MKLVDVSTGPDWFIWVVFGILAIFSLVLLSGHGSGLIAGYNTASEKEKAQYDEKKLCRTIGAGLAIIDVLVLVSEIFENELPASFAYIMAGIIVVGAIVMIIVANTVCRK